jgi:predicted permease
MGKMRFRDKLLMRMIMIFNRKRAGERLQDEILFHLEHQIEENIAAGMSPEAARRAALRTFGNPEALREQTRATWNWSSLDLLLLDLKQSIRSLRRAPAFSTTVILVLALGIGANVALFSVVHAVLLKSLPFPDPDRLVRVYEADAHGRFQDNLVTGGSFGTWKAQSKSFQDLAIKRSTGYDLSGAGSELPEFVNAEIASWNIFPLLGVQPAIGRFFTADEDRPGANATVVLTWGLWQRRYGANPAILGKTILLDARPFTVIGILPAWFQYPDAKVQLWTPLYHEKSSELMQMFGAHDFDVVGRLKPGISSAQANAELNAIQLQIRHQHPDGPVADAVNLRPILDGEVHEVRTGLYALLAATTCLLLIACLNIANLLVARAATRRREIAVRTALGGSRLRLVRTQILESLLLSAAGGIAGVGLAAAGLRWLVTVRSDIPRAESIHVDIAALVFALAAILVTGLLCGLIPALATGDRQILRALQESARSQSGSVGRVRVRRILLALEVGLTVVLLIGSGLLLKTYQHLRSVDLGCATQNVLTMDLTLPKGSYPAGVKRIAFAEQLAQRVSNLQGVAAVGLSSILPGEGFGRDDTFTIHEHPALPQGQVLDASTTFVDPGYFAAMQIPLVAGRLLTASDRLGRPLSVLVNETLVRQNFPGEVPLGKHIVSAATEDGQTYEIVGVTADTKDSVAAPARAAIYFPLYLGSERSMTLAVRTHVEPASMALPIQKVLAAIDNDVPVAHVLTMEQVVGNATLESSFDAVLLLAFALLSLILAAVGLFGVLSFLVSQRTAEIGIRLALGAERNQIARLMLADGMRPALLGLVLGLAASAVITRLIQSMLFGTHPLDPTVFAVVTVTLLSVAIAACFIPAWRASRMDPTQALRAE